MLSLSKFKPQLRAKTAPAQAKSQFNDDVQRNRRQNITVNEDRAAPFAVRIEVGRLGETILFTDTDTVAERLETLLRPRVQVEISEQ